MKAGEVKPYFDNLQADLASEADPQLRGWYETEISLSSEYQEAHTLQEKLQQLHGGLSLLLERAGVAKEAEPDPEHETMETHESYADDEIDEDEYLTAEQRKQKSVLAWLEDITAEHGENLRQASAEPKRRKRERKQAIANARFARHFERFGPQNDHIVHDAEALGYVLDELLASKPRVAELVTGSAVEYMHKHGLEFAGNHPAFAGIIRASLGEQPAASAFGTIFSAIYEKRNFIDRPEDAAKLHIGLAHTFFEVTDEPNHSYYEKILETAYLQNNIIRDKVAYATAVETLHTLGLTGGRQQLTADLLNARLTFFQARTAYLHHHENYYNKYHEHVSEKLAVSAGRSLGHRHSLADLSHNPAVLDFFNNAQHYDGYKTFDFTSGNPIDTAFGKKVIPEGWRDIYTGSELYRKRMALLAPRAIAHDVIVNGIKKLEEANAGGHVFDFPISPGVSVSLCLNFGVKPDQRIFDTALNQVFSKIFNEHTDQLSATRYVPNSQQTFGTGIFKEVFNTGDIPFGVFGVVRPAVPEDIKIVGPHSALATALRLNALEIADVGMETAKHTIEVKQAFIRQHRHNYLGRRPIRFRLPDTYRDNGLTSLDIRQHEDRSRVIVTAHHVEGDLRFLFDNEINYVGHGLEAGETAVSVSFKDLVVSLLREWACRPVIETSEGTVRSEDTRSKVNLGFLRYLPQGQVFSVRQRLRFRKEQNGGNLAVESLRRKPQDPTGLGRNSTYVRENYDPTKPPLEVYYDPRALT